MFTYLVHADKCEGVNVMIFSWWICTEPTNYCPSKSVTSAPVHWKVGIEKNYLEVRRQHVTFYSIVNH